MGSQHLLGLIIVLGNSLVFGLHKGLYTHNLLEVHETIPRKVSAEGNHVSYNLTSLQDDGQVHFNVSIKDNNHLLILEPAKHFLSPAVVIERRKRDIHTRHKPKHKSSNCQFQGVIHGQPNSRVALAACNGLAGVIKMNENEHYYIEPAHHSVKTIRPGHKHVLYKRSIDSTSNPKKRKKRKRSCGTREPKRMTRLEWQRQLGKVKVQAKKHKHKSKIKHKKTIEDTIPKKYKHKKTHKRHKRSLSSPYYVETLLVADHSMVEFHEDGDIETYLLTIMNIVSSFYMDPSIGNFVNVVVVKIIIIDENNAEPEFNVTSNADATLQSFCKWQKSLNPENESHPHHHDVAILMTRLDICAHGNTPCSTLGVAHVGGMCKSGRSCSVNEDNGITAAYTISHEMGHNFGMLHDNEKNGCKGRNGNIRHVMTPSFEADTAMVRWSNCSRREITTFLDKGLGKCLEDEPEDIEEYEYPELPPGAMYNADYQCRFQFGPDATVCTPLDEICTRLWCSVNETCTTQLRPAASGTHCGKHKWCQNQKCVPIMEPPAAIDGGWGEWSSWSECSRTCGAGVSIMQRECDHPVPTAGGRFCVGERKRYRICNTDPCPEDQPTFRAVQCSKYNNHTYEGKSYEWQPYFDKDEPCELFCADSSETLIVPWGDSAADGTPCNVVSRDICIAGICKKVGCDWVVDSSVKEDDCGICQGDGTKCDKKEGVYNKQSHSPGYREVVVIPPGARNIRIQEKGKSENYISIGNALVKKFYLNGKRHITLPGEYNVAGAQALYERDNHLEKIHIPGPIQDPIVVYLIFTGKTHNPGVEYKYSIWKPETTKQVKYSWILGDWSQCSSTCGGGVQHRRPLCQESTVSTVASELEGPTIVDEVMCDPSEQPQQLMRTCNDDPCPYHWWFGPWQSCPVTCTDKDDTAMRRRSVMCVDGQEMALPDHYCDRKLKPFEYQPCKGPMPLCEDVAD